MLPDLEQLIQLQRLTNTAMEAQRDLEAIPGRLDALNSQLTAHVEAVTAANDRLARKKNRTPRRREEPRRSASTPVSIQRSVDVCKDQQGIRRDPTRDGHRRSRCSETGGRHS